MPTPALSISNLRKVYRRGTVAVDDLSLTVNEGDFFGFLGPNGAGKSTTIHCITGIANPTGGEIKIFGLDAVKQYREARRLVGLCPQEFNVDPFAKPADIVDWAGGLKRRVVLARALVHDPKLIILDEPTAGVDVELRRVLWNYLTEINQGGRTILLTSHYLEEVERLCRHIAIVAKGRIAREGTKEEMAGTPGSLERAYLIATGAEADHVAGQ